MTRDLHELAKWLHAAQVTAVAMAATGVYWMPVWNVLEPYGFRLLLINPEHYKAVRGKKTEITSQIPQYPDGHRRNIAALQTAVPQEFGDARCVLQVCLAK